MKNIEHKPLKKDALKSGAEKDNRVRQIGSIGHSPTAVTNGGSVHPDKIVLDVRRVDSFNRKWEASEKMAEVVMEKPSYMSHTVCSLEHSRRNAGAASGTPFVPTLNGDSNVPDSPTKMTAPSSLRRKSSTTISNNTTHATSTSTVENNVATSTTIEEIWDVATLQTMLDTMVGYEQRRRIRAQIRVAKKRADDDAIGGNISDTKRSVTSVSSIAKTKTMSDGNSTTSHKIAQQMDAAPAMETSFSMPIKTTATPRSAQPDDTSKKPVWATQNILKKASDNVNTSSSARRNISKKTATSSSATSSTAVSSSTTMTTSQSRTQPTQRRRGDLDEADCVTSSYGIGPTDEEGKPLFGISALKRGSSGRNFKVPQNGAPTPAVEPVAPDAEHTESRSNGKSMFGLSALRKNGAAAAAGEIYLLFFLLTVRIKNIALKTYSFG